MRRRWLALFVLGVSSSSACTTVAQNRRQYLADPTMQLNDELLEAQSIQQLHSSREGAAGGGTTAAGGGCACGN